jgi:hypothetical protein
MKKIAIFYLIAQVGDWWSDEFFIPQMKILDDSGLSENIEFIEIHATFNKENLPFIPDKTKSINFHSDPVDAMNEVMESIWKFSIDNPGYKILFFHGDGVTHKNKTSYEYKLSNLQFIHYTLIDMWRECDQLLNFYDCVGNNFVYVASFKNHEINFYCPHFRGGFWWANSDYISKLNPKFLKQDVEWRRFLGEIWIGTGNPRYYTIHNALSEKMDTITSFYKEKTIFDKQQILETTRLHIDDITNIDSNNYFRLKNIGNGLEYNDYMLKRYFERCIS